MSRIACRILRDDDDDGDGGLVIIAHSDVGELLPLGDMLGTNEDVGLIDIVGPFVRPSGRPSVGAVGDIIVLLLPEPKLVGDRDFVGIFEDVGENVGEPSSWVVTSLTVVSFIEIVGVEMLLALLDGLDETVGGDVPNVPFPMYDDDGDGLLVGRLELAVEFP